MERLQRWDGGGSIFERSASVFTFSTPKYVTVCDLVCYSLILECSAEALHLL